MAAPAQEPLSPLVPRLAAERPVTWPARTDHTLANGLQVVLVESHTIPKFNGQLLFRSGNVAAPQAFGLADMTATVARTGTTQRTSRQIEEELRRMGADLGSSAGADTSAISFSGLSEFAEGILTLVSDLARQATFPAEELERERRQALESLKIERATPGFLAGERLRKVLFGEHPYANVSPSEEQLQSFRREQLDEFYRAHFVPANALLILVGDFVPQRMVALAEKVFGNWAGTPPAATGASPPPAPRGRQVHFVHLPGAVQTQVLLGNHAITRQHPDWLRLALANSLFGGAFNSRLIANIREQKGYTYSPRSAVHPLRQHGYFSISAAVRNDVVAATLTETFYELDRIRSLPVGEEELADARNYMSGVFSLGLATQDGLAGQLVLVYLNQLAADYLETYRDKVRALTADDVLQAARRYFDSANAQIVVVGDRAQVEAQAALFGQVTMYDARGQAL
jgi:predicted Zn-dependent peptidase